MYVRISEYGERYLTHSDFLHLCNELEIKLLNNNVDEKWLEYLEKNKILFPEYRVVKPTWYLNLIFKYRSDDIENINSHRWKEASEFFEKIEEWQRSFFVFNPFEHKRTLPFIEKPKDMNFKKWRTSRIKKDKDGDEYSIKGDVNFYPYWRVYSVYEITKMCTQRYLINVFDNEINSLYEKKHRIPFGKAKRWTAPRSPDSLRKEIFERDKDYDILSFYIQAVRRVGQVPHAFYKQGFSSDDYIRKKYDEIMNYREIRIAKFTLCRYDLMLENALEFLRYLCKKFFEYEDNNLIKLNDMLRYDIYYLIKLIKDGFNVPRELIEERIGRIPNTRFKNSIRYIFNGEIAEAREDALRIFKGYVNSVFKHNKIETEPNDFEEFLCFLDANLMSSVYLLLFRNYYQPNDYYIFHNTYDNLTALVNCFESFLKILMERNQTIETKQNLRKLMLLFFNGESWIHIVNEKLLNEYNFVTSRNINDVEKDISSEAYSSDKKLNELIQIFLLIGVFRNYVDHEYFKTFNTLNNEWPYVRKIAAAMWFCWLKTNKKI